MLEVVLDLLYKQLITTSKEKKRKLWFSFFLTISFKYTRSILNHKWILHYI